MEPITLSDQRNHLDRRAEGSLWTPAGGDQLKPVVVQIGAIWAHRARGGNSRSTYSCLGATVAFRGSSVQDGADLGRGRANRGKGKAIRFRRRSVLA